MDVTKSLSKASQYGEDNELDARVEELEEAGEEAAHAAGEHPHDQREADTDGLEGQTYITSTTV